VTSDFTATLDRFSRGGRLHVPDSGFQLSHEVDDTDSVRVIVGFRQNEMNPEKCLGVVNIQIGMGSTDDLLTTDATTEVRMELVGNCLK
jgi:hypothetical protein